MSGPRRLMDDPDFKWETGCDLADEALLLLSRVRATIDLAAPAKSEALS